LFSHALAPPQRAPDPGEWLAPSPRGCDADFERFISTGAGSSSGPWPLGSLGLLAAAVNDLEDTRHPDGLTPPPDDAQFFERSYDLAQLVAVRAHVMDSGNHVLLVLVDFQRDAVGRDAHPPGRLARVETRGLSAAYRMCRRIHARLYSMTHRRSAIERPTAKNISGCES